MKYGIYYAYWERQWGADYLKYIKKVGKLGFDILEISCAGVKDLREEEADRLRACAEEEGVLLTGGYGPKPSEDLSSADPEVVKNGFQFWKNTPACRTRRGIWTAASGT